MNVPPSAPPTDPGVPGRFATTHWSLVLSAGQAPATAHLPALEQLCQSYWPPLYAYARRKGHAPHDAQDLTQEFFARLMEDNFLGTAREEKGRFRSFLLTAFNHFLTNEWVRAKARKRGGGQTLLPLDMEANEAQWGSQLAHDLSPDRLYEKRWALALLEKVIGQLREDYVAGGKAALFDALRGTLSGDGSTQGYEAIAASLNLTEGAVKVAVHRLRDRYRVLLRAEIANTVAAPEEVDDEIRQLFAALGT